MNTKEININGNVYLFENEYKSTRIGFVHITRLYINGLFREINTSHYINRAWERYDFQNSMIAAVYKQLREEEQQERIHFLKSNGFSRMTPKRSKEFQEYLGNCPYYKELESVYNRL